MCVGLTRRKWLSSLQFECLYGWFRHMGFPCTQAHIKTAYGPLPVLKTISDVGSAEGDLDVLSKWAAFSFGTVERPLAGFHCSCCPVHGRSERQQVLDERDDALEQLRRMEASRDELARQQGQYKGRVAKVNMLGVWVVPVAASTIW